MSRLRREIPADLPPREYLAQARRDADDILDAVVAVYSGRLSDQRCVRIVGRHASRLVALLDALREEER